MSSLAPNSIPRGAVRPRRRRRRRSRRGLDRLYDPFDDTLKTFGRRWLPTLLMCWALLQTADVLLTYWGLSLPTIFEANPVMTGVIDMPLRVIAIKAMLTVSIAALLLRIEYGTPFSSVPIFVLINVLMAYVFFNNWGLIAQAGGHIVNGAITAP